MIPSSFFHEAVKLAMPAAAVSPSGMQKGDIILTTMSPKRRKSSFGARLMDRLFRGASTKLQGDYTHSAIYVGNGQIVESRLGEGVQRKTLEGALKNLKGAIVMRPKAPKKIRAGAADFAKKQVGKDYARKVFLGAQGATMVLPQGLERLLRRGGTPDDTQRFTCSNLAAASYISQGHTPREGKGSWAFTVPGDFLNLETNKRVKVLGKRMKKGPTAGRLQEVIKLARRAST